MCNAGGRWWAGGINTFYYQQKGLLLVSVRFSCQRLLLLVPVKQKVMFTWLMLKGHGAVVSATYGLLGRARNSKKRGKDGKKERARLTLTEGLDTHVLRRLFSKP